jgi:hypothetical protein
MISVHHPNAISFAVSSFDLLEKFSQRGFIRGVACQNFVGDGKTFGRNDKDYDYLHTVITFITTVTKLTFILWIKVCITLKIGLSCSIWRSAATIATVRAAFST